MRSSRSGRGSLRTAARLAAAALLAFSVAACDDAGPDVTPDPAPVASAPAPATTSAAAAPAPTGSASRRTVAATELCDFLRKKLPAWKSVGGESAAQAQLAVDLFTFYQERGVVPAGRDIDEQTTAQCPDVRTEVLAAAGIDNFLIL